MNLKSRFLPSVLIFLMVVFTSGVWQIELVNAASLSSVSDVMSREAASAKSTHKIVFTSTTAMVAAGTIAINFATFTGTIAVADVQICHGATTGLEHGTAAVTGTSCTATDETVSASNGASTQWGAAYASSTLTLTAPSGSWTNLISAGQKVTIFVTAANITNPALSTPTVTITNSNGDSGSFTVDIIDSDQVGVTATVNQSISFDLDTYNTSTTSTEQGPVYSVALGTLTTGAVTGTTEGAGGTPNGIWFDLNTNAGGGAVVSITSANGALKSTSTPGDTIPSASAAMVAGTPNYGVCANRNAAATGTLTKVAPFASTCTTTPSSNTVGAVTTSPQAIYNTNNLPIAAGRGEIMVDAAISGVTPAHSDYADTLTLIATGTF